MFFLQMEILKHWNINPTKIHNNINILGSPERTLKREVYEDNKGRLYVLESFNDFEKKTIITKNIQYLYEKGLPVNPYLKLKSKNNCFTLTNGSKNYQISKYIEGIELPRPDYLKDKWRGEAMARFLIQLRNTQPPIKIEGANLREYIKTIAMKMNLEEFSNYLSDFFAMDMEKSFCHGDFHPLNVIWGEKKINSVIDWEFSGSNYRTYDLCNLLGCVGSEGPWFFESEFVKGLFAKLDSTYLTKTEFDNIPYLMLAIRFGWLAEWVRFHDEEMIELEIAYMSFIKENHSYLLNEFTKFSKN